MSRRHLTAAAVSRIKPPAAGQVDHFDAGYPGLALRISTAGPLVGLLLPLAWQAAATHARALAGAGTGGSPRCVARGAQKAVQGLEPTAAAAPGRAPISSAMSLTDWLKRDQGDNRSPRRGEAHSRQGGAAGLGHLRIAEITRGQISRLIDASPTAAPSPCASLSRASASAVPLVGRARDHRGEPDGIPAQAGRRGEAQARAERRELGLVWDAAQQIGWPMGSAIQLLILTCARREEIGALQWREINRARNEIHLEGERTKNGEDHAIPLSVAAQDLIDTIPRVAGSPFVFTTTGNTPISGWSRAKENIDEIMLARAQLAARDCGESEKLASRNGAFMI